MKQVILDTSFILTAVRQKIDFSHEFEMQGFQVLMPNLVLRELEGLAKKPEAALALKIISKNKFKTVSVKGKTVDAAIINFAKDNPKIFVATLDREIKNKTKNPKIVIRQKKMIGVA